ncbi:MAG TPA: biotin carboxylase N-terminal domain-containing protein [Bdellovibrionota bacterium]|jgi:acetyl/propionyl-CoA carboxylase alpha subunit
MMKFRRVLILNRGEIACRLIQACQELGLETVAIYSDVDKGARHIELADDSIHLPGSSPKETYLNLNAILPAAKKKGCDAVHPGYGFLSERAQAAEAFTEAGLCWIGPSAKSIRMLGDKLEAKRLLDKYGVPTTPWGEADPKNGGALSALAEKIGYPVLLKAASGGGGKGMRLVKTAKELHEAAESAAREAQSSFGDATLLLEKFVEQPRHIEIQILGDNYGNVIHFGERECSLQRRHQKVLEEAPAPNLSQKAKDAIAQSALQLAQGVGYSNAGTVEFLVDKDENFYFLEVNSRLQVEHSVTESVWGVDLVHAQIRIAQGEKISALFPDRAERKPRGHSIQARIYAEDASAGFSPCPGTLALVEWPQAVGLRVDTGVRTGSTIGLDYDAMIAKLTVSAETRERALDRLLWCLRHTVIFGTVTNINYLQDVLTLPEVKSGRMHVKLLETALASWKDSPPEELLAQHSTLLAGAGSMARSASGSAKQANPSPWERG